MKLGILTYHRSPNYGALWQAYALKTFLTDKGYNVSVIDYWPDYHRRMYAKKMIGRSSLRGLSLLGKLSSVYKSLRIYAWNYLRLRRTNAFSNKYLQLTLSRKFDICIYGSDQIWRKQHQYDCESFNPIYFGNEDINATKKISYAASMGYIEIDSEIDKAFINSSLKNFDAMSVREDDLGRELSLYTQKEIKVVSDPVFLLSMEQWKKILPKKRIYKKKYIFLYNLEDDATAFEIAQKLSEKYNLPIREVRGYVNDKKNPTNRTQTASPISFLSSLYNAEFVVTSAFHGVALSLCFNKQFYYAAPDELAGRAMSLLKRFRLDDRRIKNISSLAFDNINYLEINPFVEVYRNQSQNWLIDTIKE